MEITGYEIATTLDGKVHLSARANAKVKRRFWPFRFTRRWVKKMGVFDDEQAARKAMKDDIISRNPGTVVKREYFEADGSSPTGW